MNGPVATDRKPGAIEFSGLDGRRVEVPAGRLRELDARIGGSLLRPGDDGWDEAVGLWNGMVAKQPALAVQPTSARDVSACVDFARDHRLLISVKGGGHNIAGTAVAEGGLLLDMARMRDVTVDPEAALAHVGPGCLLRDVDRATQAHGLATVLGFVSETGVAGLTLGGGLGYLTRRFGWAVDNLEEVEIVTADGRTRTASRRENEDLFWAVRGAGANLGVVTRFTYRLHQVGPTVFGGLVAWPFERADEVLPAYRDLTVGAPRELSVWLILRHAPPAPFVPREWHGRRICAMSVCFSGDPARAEEAIAPIRELGDPILDLLGQRPYVEVQSQFDGADPRGHHYYWKTEFVDALSDGLLSTMRELSAGCPVPGAELGILHLGGALNERSPDDGAVGNRDARYAIGVLGMWEPGEPAEAAYRDWVRDAGKRVARFSTGGNYVNFQTADEGEERIRAMYGGNLARLVDIKTLHDPENLFRSNRNIRPRARSGA